MFGNTELTPESAYRFARGEVLDVGAGQKVRLARPLDFLVVADHAELLGFLPMIRSRDPEVMRYAAAGRVARFFEEKGSLDSTEIIELSQLLGDPQMAADPELRKTAWARSLEISERMNEPGVFSAIIGYEWSSMPDGHNLHRVVVYRDGADKAGATLPYSSMDSSDPEDLWRFFERYEAQTGGGILAIPHNSNLSRGWMFGLDDFKGDPITRSYAKRRQHWEPVAEVTQIKGDSETHPFLSPDDEFADFETWDETDIPGTGKVEPRGLPGDYVRSALKRGLAIGAATGVNPYKLGMIGSTDSHTSLATADDDNYLGKTFQMVSGPGRSQGNFFESRVAGGEDTLNWEQAASGYAGVWASENTRAALFDAFRRREIYATTGPRMTVRFFGGWRFEESDAESRDLVGVGYAKGVPMGGDLPRREFEGGVPTFLISAGKDPMGAQLDRIQVVKGWRDSSGELHERVYDAVLARDRSAGAAELTSRWHDPDFDATEPAFYYARVLEVETRRWNDYDQQRLGVEQVSGARMTTRERAYTSPVWYEPEA